VHRRIVAARGRAVDYPEVIERRNRGG